MHIATRHPVPCLDPEDCEAGSGGAARLASTPRGLIPGDSAWAGYRAASQSPNTKAASAPQHLLRFLLHAPAVLGPD